MKKIKQTFMLFFISAVVWGKADWKTLRTKHFTVFYKPGYEVHAWEVLRSMEYYRPYAEKLTGNLAFNLPVVIQEAGTLTQGLADSIFVNTHLFTYPPSRFFGHGLGSTENWWSLVGVHEYVHILHLTKTAGVPKILQTLFGNIPFFLPNLFSPDWLIEGFAVYGESQLSKFQGRLNDGFFDAYIGACVKDGRLPSLPKVTCPPTTEYPGGAGIYLYGGKFFNYLAETYGEEKFAKFFHTYGSSVLSFLSPILPFISLDRATRLVYGKSFSPLWKEWQKYENERFKDFIMDGERITFHGWDIMDLRIHNDKLYYIRSYRVKTGFFRSFRFNEIIERDIVTCREKTIVSHTSSFAMPMRIRNGKLYYAVDEVKFGHANAIIITLGLHSIIHERDLSTGKEKIILRDEIRSFDVFPDGRIIYSKDKKDKFGSEVYLYEPKTKQKKLLFTTDYLIDEIISDEKRIIVSARKDWENFSLYALSLDTGELTALVHTPYTEGQIFLSGDKLFFNANYEKKHSIYCYDFSIGKVYRLTENGFATSPVYDEKENMIYFVGLTSHGNDIYRKRAEFKEFQPPTHLLRSPVPPYQFEKERTIDESKVIRGNYFDNLKALTPKIHIPYFTFGNAESYAGIFLRGMDAVRHFSYTALFQYDFKENKPEFSIAISNNFFAPLINHIIYDTTDKDALRLRLAYPFLIKLSPGLSFIGFGTDFFFFEDFSRRAIAPGGNIRFRYPKTRIDLGFTMPIELKAFGSTVDNVGLSASLWATHYLRNSQIDIVTLHRSFPVKSTSFRPYYLDPDILPVNHFPIHHRFKQIFKARNRTRDKISSLSIGIIEYTRPLLKIRGGLWNPNIFFEDLCMCIFASGDVTDGDPSWGVGLEFGVEGFSSFGNLLFRPRITITVNDEGEVIVSIGL